jgi:hypothetical protein
MNRHLFIIGFVSLFFLASSFSSYIALPGGCDAPMIGAGYTSAPSEGSCGQSGCHSGVINSGPGITIFESLDAAGGYTPGETYSFSMKMNQNGIDKFGFQITALEDSTNSFTGNFVLTDPTNTRNINGPMFRKYVGSTPCGSDAIDSIEWQFDWTAPADNVGEVTFYYNTISTNHNHGGSGDDTYSGSLTVAPMITGIDEIQELSDLSIFPNPANGVLNVEYFLSKNAPVNVSLLNMDGSEIEPLLAKSRASGKHSETFLLGEMQLPTGLYFLKIEVAGKSILKKISIVK